MFHIRQANASSDMAMATMISIICVLSCLVSPCRGHSLRLHTFVDSHMVLQREPMQARIWGWAKPLANVTAVLQNGVGSAFGIANDAGLWTIDLPPQPAGSGHTITVSDGKSTMLLEDVAFDERPGCSECYCRIQDSINYPDLRLATVELIRSSTPLQDVPSKAPNYTWTRSSPDAFGADSFSYVSATCYFFGRDLYKKFGGSVPIGLVVSCWGGQKVEAFSSPDALNDETCGGTYPAVDSTNGSTMTSTKTISDDFFGGQIEPAELWNAMIHPLLPMRFLGSIWYQGESNEGNATSYACRFPAMITDWREKFELPMMSFVYVELAGYAKGATWAYVRAAQGAALRLHRVGFATAIDLADRSSPVGQIHPGRKQEVGRRLSLSVSSIQYKEDILSSGPLLSSFYDTLTLNGGDGAVDVILYFEPNTAEGMHFHGSADCTACCSESPFEVMDSNGNWTRVEQSRVQRPNLVVLHTKVSKVFGIRYAWEPIPQCILYNGVGGPDDHMGLPATPFESCLHKSNSGPWTGKGCRVDQTSLKE
eukprot:scaffold5048_cov121-Cylindrotheca_fusiformis.AAC.20